MIPAKSLTLIIISRMKEKIISKLNKLIAEAEGLLEEIKRQSGDEPQAVQAVKESKFGAFKTGSLSFLKTLLGGDEIYYLKFYNGVKYHADYSLVLAIELLQKIKADIDDGWLQEMKGIVAAELFSDFLDMAEHLLEESYYQPAAVMIGSVLEESLRALSLKSGLPVSQPDSSGKLRPIKAEALNTVLAKNHVYNLLMQKSVTAWLDLRNKAAHGQHGEYDAAMVQMFLLFARDFAARYA